MQWCYICLDIKEEFLSESVEKWFNSKKDLINSIDFMRIIEQVQKFEIDSKNLLQPDIALEALFVKLSIMGNTVQISDILSNFDTNNFENKSINETSVENKQTIDVS